MARIIGNTTATPNPRPDWNQTDETKADYIKNKPTEQFDKAESHYSDSNNPHKVTAEQVGVYTKDEVDEIIANNEVDLSAYAKKDEIFETNSFAWTDFDYTLPTNDNEASYVNENALNVGGTDQPIVVRCAGKTLGFTFRIIGYSDAYLTINGITTTYTNSAYDGSEFATNIVIPPTYMESDIEFSGGMNTWTFTDMTIQSIKDVSELEEQLGDIDTALDSIIAIQEELMPKATLG